MLYVLAEGYVIHTDSVKRKETSISPHTTSEHSYAVQMSVPTGTALQRAYTQSLMDVPTAHSLFSALIA